MRARSLLTLTVPWLLACGAPTPAPAGPEQPATASAVSPEPPSKPQHFDVAAIDAYVAAQVERKGFVGLSLAIVRDGELVLARGYGKSSLATGAPVEPDTTFAIGSVTKQFTCASVLLLAQDGRLARTDPVAKYYPAATRAADITLDHLLANTSGYPDYYPLDFVDERMARPIEPDELIARYTAGPLDFEPGSRWSYSNTGFVLAGRVVERVSGEPLGDFMQRRIFGPAGMQHAAFEPAPGGPGMATGHTSFALGAPVPAVPEARGWMHAAGAIYASATDLARWDLALMGGGLLQPESWRGMITARGLSDGDVTDYGCGIGVGRRQGRPWCSTAGPSAGFWRGTR